MNHRFCKNGQSTFGTSLVNSSFSIEKARNMPNVFVNIRFPKELEWLRAIQTSNKLLKSKSVFTHWRNPQVCEEGWGNNLELGCGARITNFILGHKSTHFGVTWHNEMNLRAKKTTDKRPYTPRRIKTILLKTYLSIEVKKQDMCTKVTEDLG